MPKYTTPITVWGPPPSTLTPRSPLYYRGYTALPPCSMHLRARRARSDREAAAASDASQPALARIERGARTLYLKLPTRQTIKRGTGQAKILHASQIKSHTYHSSICTESPLRQDVHPPLYTYKGDGILTSLASKNPSDLLGSANNCHLHARALEKLVLQAEQRETQAVSHHQV